VLLILAQSDDEPKKPKKPGDETPPGLKQIVAQSDDEPKKPKKPEEPKFS
jgi:hypothetical protein